MRKELKVRLISLFVAGIMAISVIGGVFFYIDSPGSRNQAEQITGYVVKGNVSESLRQQYIARGLTFIEVHYDSFTEKHLRDIESLPTQLTTPGGSVQAIVVEIESSDPKIIVESLNGIEEVSFDDPEMFEKLCRILYYPPVECIAANLTIPEPSTQA